MQKTTLDKHSSGVSILSEEIIEYLGEKRKYQTAQAIDFIFKSNHIIQFLNKINFKFKSTEQFLTSITHNSFCNEFSYLHFKSNQCLEYLGDAVIDLIIATKLIEKFPKYKEGNLSKLRSALVNEASLYSLAKTIGLGEVILIGKGEVKDIGYDKPSVLSDAFEALMGAIYKDSGFEASSKVFFNILDIYKEINGVDFITSEKLDAYDPKTRLQELTVAMKKGLPQYQLCESNTDDFKIELIIDEKIVLSKIGKSKKQIEKELALEALKNKLYQ